MPPSFDRTGKLQGAAAGKAGRRPYDLARALGEPLACPSSPGTSRRRAAIMAISSPPERRAPGTLLAAGRGIPNEMEFQVHFYDERGKAPLCGSPIPPPWGWTAKRANVTCPECLKLLTRLPPPSNDGRRAGR